MSKFESAHRNPGLQSVVTTLDEPTGLTYNQAPGFERGQQSELFLLASQFMVDEKTFYEKSEDRQKRFRQLIWYCSVEHEQWTLEFLQWLRADANIRSAAIAGACEFIHGRWFLQQELAARGKERTLDATLGRRVANVVCQRPDEPNELLAYWVSNYGKPLPAALRRGAGDAAVRLYTEYAAGKYDGESRAWRMGDLLQLARPAPKAAWQDDLFGYLIGKRLGKREDVPDTLEMVAARASLESMPVAERRGWLETSVSRAAETIKFAGMPWEAVSGWVQGPMDKVVWEACIPSMGVFALLRNLRNFDDKGVSDAVAQDVCARISNFEAVRAARVFPMRYLSAHRAVASLRWGWALEQGLAASLSLLPLLKGRTLVLIDTSDSMFRAWSEDSDLVYADVAKSFGLALAKRIVDSDRGDAVDVVSYSSTHPSSYWDNPDPYFKPFTLRRGESVLAAVKRWESEGLDIRAGTHTEGAVAGSYHAHDRVVLLTDEQSNPHHVHDVFAAVPSTKPCYTYNIAGYKDGHAPSGKKNRHVFGGLSDSSFVIMSALESHQSGRWPWEHAKAS